MCYWLGLSSTIPMMSRHLSLTDRAEGVYITQKGCADHSHQYKGKSLLVWHDHRCKTRPEAVQVSLQSPEAFELRSVAGTSCWYWFYSHRCNQDQRALLDLYWSTHPFPVPLVVTLQTDIHTGGSRTQAALTVMPPVPLRCPHNQSAAADGPWPQSSWRIG